MSIGDVILVKRYSSKEEQKKIHSGHKVGPYIVLEICDDYINGIYCSGASINDNEKISSYLLDVHQADFSTKKVTYARVSSIHKLTKEQYVMTLGHLNKKDINGIQKLIVALNVRVNNAIQYHYSSKIPSKIIRPGDIIKYQNKLYFVYVRTSEFFLVNPVISQGEDSIYTYNGIRISIDCNYRKKISLLHEDIVTLYFTEKSQLEKIIAINIETNKISKDENAIRYGSIVKIMHNLYIVYERVMDSWRLYKIYTNTNNIKGGLVFKYTDAVYKTYLEESYVPLKNELKARKNIDINGYRKIKFQFEEAKKQKLKGNFAKVPMDFSTIGIGSIVRYDKTMCLIYQENDTFWKAYKLMNNNTKAKEVFRFSALKGSYMTICEIIEIPKSEVKIVKDCILEKDKKNIPKFI